MLTKNKLDQLYKRYNHREFVHPDPLEFLYSYPDIPERELVGLIASSLAYGRVAQILKSVSLVLEKMSPSPRAFLMKSSDKSITSSFANFKHRFTTGEEMALMLIGTKRIIKKYGSLYNCFIKGYRDTDDTILPALTSFTDTLNNIVKRNKNSLLPSPSKGSACKRLNLFLRWMIREDEVDPGGWNMIPASKLIIPLDTHMYSICFTLNMTGRKQANMQTAIDITKAFGKIIPDDPVRYDFALTRLGIRKDTDKDSFLRECQAGKD